MVEGKTLGELSEGNEVTQSWSWKDDDVRLKMTSFLLFCGFHVDFILWNEELQSHYFWIPFSDGRQHMHHYIYRILCILVFLGTCTIFPP